MTGFKKLLFLLMVTLGSIQSFAQDLKVDSLLKLLDTELSDTSLIRINLRLSKIQFYTHTDTAKHYANKALKIAQKNKIPLSIINAYCYMAICSNIKTEYDEAQTLLSQALEINNHQLEKEPANIKYQQTLIRIYNGFGVLNYYKGKFNISLNYDFMVLQLAKEINDKNSIANSLNNISLAYNDLNNYTKALEYAYKALAFSNLHKNDENYLYGLKNVGSIYLSSSNYDSAQYYISKSIQLNEATDSKPFLIDSYDLYATIFRETEQPDSALKYYKKSLNISNQLNNIEGKIIANFHLSELYFKMNDLVKAKKYSEIALQHVNSSGMQYMKYNINEHLSNIYKAKGDYKMAYQYYVEATIMKNRMYNAKSDQQIADLEVKYAARKQIDVLSKENQIDKLEIDKKSATVKIIILLAILVLIVLLFSFLHLQKRQKIKQMLALQKSQEKLLKTERKVLSSIIETEDKERKRFAEDIHDGISPLLSSIKLYLGEIKHSEDKEEKEQMIEYASELTSDAIINVRETAHNIMPSLLSKEGLTTSLENFFEKIRFTKKLDIQLNNKISKLRYSQSIELILFRTICELINNTIKHAKATIVTLSIEEKDKHLIVHYTDNGIGFNIQKTENENGIGLSNVQNRINSVNGISKIDSKEGEGLSVTINIPI